MFKLGEDVTRGLENGNLMIGQRRFDELVRKRQVPGATLAVLVGDDVHALASGVLNLDTDVAATPDSMFQLASITKVYTATVFMRLVEQGLVGLGTPVSEVLPDFKVADPDVTRRVTMRHLLTHTSGIGGDFFRGDWRGDDCVERYVAACAEVGQDVPLSATPSYSNTGFCILGRVIEVLTGFTWDQAIGRYIREPLGLAHTWTLPEEVIRFRVSMGHLTASATDAPTVAPLWEFPLRGMGPCGAVSATASDVVAFARMHLIDPALAVMRQPQAAVPGPLIDHWGLGWMLWNWNGHEVFGHSGDNYGQSAHLLVVPDAGVAIALMANIDRFALFQRDVFGELLPDLCGIRMPSAPAPAAKPFVLDDPARFAGRYERFGAHVEVTLGGDGMLHLAETRTGDLADAFPPFGVDLIPVAEGRFVGWLESGERWTPVTFADDRFVYLGVRAATRLSP
jgi:CubicO group peptidase (beta-lactamase class C family)